RRVKPTKPISIVQSMEPCTLSCPVEVNTEAPWCKVFHHTTEKWMMGTLIAVRIAKTALRRARRAGSSLARRSARYARAKTPRIAVEVSRASQAHHTPQVGRPQIDPVISVREMKTTLISIEQYAMRSRFIERVRFHRYRQ